MTDMLVRNVQDNRLLQTGGELQTTLGQSLRATFDQPMWTGLVVREMELAKAGGTAFTEDQRIARREEMESRWRENDMLQSELLTTTDPAREQEIVDRIDELQREADLQLDALTRESIDAGRMQTPGDLTEEYGDLGLTFDRPMARKEAELLAQGKREEIIRNAIVQAGPQGVGPTVARFGAGLAATAVDPLELASMFIPVVGPGRRAWLTAKLGRVGGRAATGAIEGVVGAAITEPFYYGLSRSQQLDYTMADALLNVGLGAVLGGALGAGAGVFSRADVDGGARGLDLFDDAISEINLSRARRASADVALRQFSLGQSVRAIDLYQSISAKDEIASLHRSLQHGRKKPITSFIRENYKVAPDGEFGRELKAIGVTPQTAPGLFARNGLNDLDNIVAREADQSVPGIAMVVGEDSFYLDRQGLLDAISDEVSGGDPLRVRSDTQSRIDYLEAYDARIQDIARQADELGFSIRDVDELRALDRMVESGANIEDAFERLAIADEAQARSDIARNAQDPALDPLANIDASVRADTPAPDTMMADTLADLEAMVGDLEKAGALDADMKADLAEVKEIGIKSRSYRAATEAATTCLLGA